MGSGCIKIEILTFISTSCDAMLGSSTFGRKCIVWVARGFGVGLSPYAPGTLGTFLGIPIILSLDLLPVVGAVIGVIALVLLSVWISGYASRGLDTEDDPSIVIDEIAGFVVAMMFVPITLWTVVSGFVLFRIFDIFKPPPANWLDKKCKGGLGITGDDIVAGVYVNIILQLALCAL